MPKELILNLASWISFKFYSKCNNIIIDYYIIDNQNIANDKHQLKEKLTEIEDALEKMQIRNANLESQISSLAGPYTNNPTNHNCLVTFKKN